MLYKVCIAGTFAEEPDMVGIIQADTLALIRYESLDPEFGVRGVDQFTITPLSGDVFMFLIEDWPYVFNRLERHL